MKGKTDLVERKADPASSTCIYQQAHRLCANSLQYMGLVMARCCRRADDIAFT